MKAMSKPLVVILMGSKADLDHCQKIAEACKGYGLEPALHIGSAHKTPQHVLEILEKYASDPRPKVYITVAGRSNALSGFVDGAVDEPVIACPPISESYGGVDIFSSLRMPSGIAPAVVLEPINAARLAAKMLGLVDAGVHAAVSDSRRKAAEAIKRDDEEI
jgi:5-(carboxyamino)imidazole ribonucleotide mutase